MSNSLDPDQARHFVGPDLGPNCLQIYQQMTLVDKELKKNSHDIFQKMVVKFHRDKSKPANEDVAELVYLMSEDKIQVTYHTEDKRIASSTREFVKPHNWDEKGATYTFSQDMHQTFQVGMR